MKMKEIEQIIRDYHWLIREIARLRNQLQEAGGGKGRSFEEMGMPKAKGGIADTVFQEAARREKQWKRIERLEAKVKFVQERMDAIEDDRDRAALDCMLDGMSVPEIARHFGLSQRYVYMMRDRIVSKLADAS